MNSTELTDAAKRLQLVRGDSEVHHSNCDRVAYDILKSILLGTPPAELLEAAKIVVDERSKVGWWYA